MRLRRAFLYFAAISLAALACVGLFVTRPFAQEMMGPEAGMGMPGGPGGPGAGGAGGGGGRSYSWVENEMPEELLMTYGEFLAREGQAPVPMPDVYLMDDEGVPKRYTRNMWYSLARIYEDVPVVPEAPNVGGRGGRMWASVWEEAAVKHNEVNVIWGRWKDALTNFSFKVGHPRIGPQLLQYDWERKAVRRADGTIAWSRWEATLPDAFTITVPVIMSVNEKCRRTYGEKFYKAMKRFDNPGHGRSPFEFVTFDTGMFRPHTFYLADEAIRVWNDLWGRVDVQLRLYDTREIEIVRASQPSGLTPSLFTQMHQPPTINYTPRYRLLLPPDDQSFHGAKLNLEGKRGWYFEFEFTLTRDQLKSLDDASARLIVNGGPPEQMKYLSPADTAAAAAAGGGMGEMGAMGGAEMAGAGPAMPGGPGAGAMGMGPQ